jgi:hypothetical protein
MKRAIIATAVAGAIAPVLVSGAFAATTPGGSWSFTDYTPDPGSLLADDAIHVVTGAVITSYCHGSRMPTAPQDVNAYRLKVSKASRLDLALSSTGAWGVDVDTLRGAALAGAVTSEPTTPAALHLRLQPGSYVVQACNLGGAPTANVSYQLTALRK